MTAARPVVFVTDYGLGDEYVGICHAVVARLAPEVRVIDLSHGVTRGDVLEGAVTLASAAPHAPEDAVYLAVVDPGVGTDRRAVALEAGRASLVGPDNGLLSLAADAIGGVSRAVAIDPGRVAPGPVSATFHGRDVFAPAAAMLATGVSLRDVGTPVDPASLVRVEVDEPSVEPGRLEARVLGVDRFGNVRLSAKRKHLIQADIDAGSMEVRAGGETWPIRQIRTFSDVEGHELGLLEDSAGWLAVVRHRSSAADPLGLRPHDRVVLSAAGGAVG